MSGGNAILDPFWQERQLAAWMRAEMMGPGRISLWGDSVTDYTVPAWQGIGSKGLSFDRIAVPGGTIEDLAHFGDPILAALRPSCAIVMIGTNNVIGGITDPVQFLDWWGTIIPALRGVLADRMKIACVTMPPMDPTKYPAATAMKPALLELNQVTRQAAINEQGLPLLDVYAALAGPDGFSLPGDTLADGIHPSLAGSLKIKALYDARIDAWGLT